MTARTAAALLLYCRAGFESDLAKEIAHVTAAASLAGFVRSKPDSGYVEFVFHEPADSGRIASSIRFADLVFARQMVEVATWLDNLPVGDRVSALMPAIDAIPSRFSAVFLETADTNEAKELSSFLRSFAKPLDAALKKSNRIGDADVQLPRLHLFFTGSSRVCVGWSMPDNASPWPMGIPRLSMPRQAPSRSTLKLAEAIQWFLSADVERESMHEGIAAVDLGASPGGWTYQLVRRGVAVTAIDNGPVDRSLLDTGLVEHERADGFTWRPRYPVEWMVCDMVEQPIRVARLVAAWLADGDCRRSIFNLKLPMKKRWDEVNRCRATMDDIWRQHGMRGAVRFRQLYHDREEVTGYALRLDDVKRTKTGTAGRKERARTHDRRT